MKKWNLVASVFQLCVGIAGVAAYIVIAIDGEPIGKWTVTLLLAVAFIVLGVIGLANRSKE